MIQDARWSLSAIVLALVACGAELTPQRGPWSDEPASTEQRKLLSSSWDTLAIGGGAADSSLGELWLAAADSSMVVVWDNITQEALAFTPDLKPLWRFGRKGAGPGEFRQARSLAFTQAGEILVFDVAAQRVTFVTRQGTMRDAVLLKESAEQVRPMHDGQLLGLAPNRIGTPLVTIPADGQSAAELPLPWSGFDALHPLVRSGFIASDPSSGAAVMVMAYGDGWFGFPGQPGATYTGRYVEHQLMPGIQEKGDTRLIMGGTLAGQAVSIAAGVVTVLHEGASPEARRWLDQYRLTDGQYLGSYLLPRRINGFASMPDGSFLVVFNVPSPTIMRLRAK
ncbi:MAG: hypothetical protein IPP98_05540 [Gemmatimonadetes bacterium]|nr:hypothetical protein [Gemmatimonadota bacterium]